MRGRIALGFFAAWMLSCGGSDSPSTGDGGTTAGSTGATTGGPDDGVNTLPPVDDTGMSASGSGDDGPECTLANVAEVCADTDPCTIDDCFDGMCTNEVAPDGSPCSVGDTNGVCEAGSCQVMCEGASDCDDDNPCTADSCDIGIGQCTFENMDGDAPASEQTEADCANVVCRGGATVSEPDN